MEYNYQIVFTLTLFEDLVQKISYVVEIFYILGVPIGGQHEQKGITDSSLVYATKCHEQLPCCIIQ